MRTQAFFSTRLRAGISYAPAAESVRSQAPSPPVGVLRKAFSFESVFRPPKPSAPPRRTSSRQTCGKGRGGQGGAGRRGAPRGAVGRLGARSRGRRPRGPTHAASPAEEAAAAAPVFHGGPPAAMCVCVRALAARGWASSIGDGVGSSAGPAAVLRTSLAGGRGSMAARMNASSRNWRDLRRFGSYFAICAGFALRRAGRSRGKICVRGGHFDTFLLRSSARLGRRGRRGGGD